MTKETDLLEFNDVLCDLNSLFEQYGVRTVMNTFRDFYPQMFKELEIQINRIPNQKQIPALLKKPGEV